MLVELLVYRDREKKVCIRYTCTNRAEGRQFMCNTGPLEEDEVLNKLSNILSVAEFLNV